MHVRLDLVLDSRPSEYIGVEMNRVSVSALSAGAYTATLYVMVNRVKWGGREPPTLTSMGKFFHHDGMYARKRTLPLCVYSVNKPMLSLA